MKNKYLFLAGTARNISKVQAKLAHVCVCALPKLEGQNITQSMQPPGCIEVQNG